MNQFDRSLMPVGIGALLSAALAALSSLLSMITGASFFSVLAIILAALGVVFGILILSKIKARSGSGASFLSSASPEENVQSAIRQLERMAEGNFSDEMPSDPSDPLLNAVAHLQNTIGQIMVEVSDEMTAISDNGTQLSSASERLSQGFFRQGEMLSGIYDSVTTVSKAAVKNAEFAREANGFAAAAADDVQKGSDQMQELLGAMDEINRSTDEIAKFIKAIEDIAFQTNILALNSSVEAAHAGEAGKGFAVVATEVKTLANRSQETAKNTGRLIQSCVASARIGVEKTSAAVKALAAASEETRSVRGLIDVISRECDAQSDSIGKINQDFAQIEGIMNSANAAASECSEKIRTLSGHSDRLRSDLKDFKGMARSHTNRAGKPVGSESMEPAPAPKPAVSAASTAKPSAPAPKPAASAASTAKSSAPAPKPAASAASTAKPSAPAPKPAASAASAAKPSAPAPKPAASTASTAKPSAPAPKPAASAASTAKPSAPAPKPAANAASTAKPSAPAPKPAAKAASTVKSSAPAPKPAASAASTTKPSAPAPKPAASVASTVKPSAPAPKPTASTTKPAVPKPAAAGTTIRSTPAPKAAPAGTAAATGAQKKSEPMPTALPEKFEAVKFVDIPDSKY